MTNEQREAIELAKEFTKMDFSNPMGWTGYYDAELEELSQAIDTVLNLIKEQQEEIVKLKVNLAKSCADRTLDRETLKNQENENLEALHRAYNEELDKKNKQIDLMARAIDNYDSQLEINTFKDKEHVKQYFADKAKMSQ